MTIFLVLCSLYVLAGAGALLFSKNPRRAQNWGAGGSALASVGLLAWLAFHYRAALAGTLTLQHAWPLPGASFHIAIDPLSLVFLAPLLLLSACSAVYGMEYMRQFHERRSIGLHWLQFNLLVLSMIFVVVSRNAILFLLVWEVMSLSSFFLATFENENDSVLDSGWTYLVSTHIGTAFLLVLFLVMGGQSGSFEFSVWSAHAWNGQGASVLFLLALVGFGSKAGFIPFHVWLPLAHPAAPSHVSALMSGIMIKMGIYGIAMILSIIGHPKLWWAMVLLGMGIVSGILGVLFALGQHDMKRMLAYSSVENIGIIAIGLGMGTLGKVIGSPVVSVLGFAGALLHVVNHAMFKGLLFMGSGAVAHATGTRDMNKLGGLLKQMPQTGLLFLSGAVAISGIPPFNGFIGEFLILKSSWTGGYSPILEAGTAAVVGLGSLALVGGLAVACFARAFGIVFLGEPRTSCAKKSHEVGPAMRGSMTVLGVACIFIGLGSAAVIGLLSKPVELLSGHAASGILQAEKPILYGFVAVYAIAAVLFLIAFRIRILALRKHGAGVGPTWGCGYAMPESSMQYTSSSFVSPVVDFFAPFLRGQKRIAATADYFPQNWHFRSEVADWFLGRIYAPAFRTVELGLKRFLWVQSGRLNLYVLYIAAVLLVFVIWKIVLQP